jgi:hypothetical protein
MYEMMDLQASRQRREEILRQAERGRVAGALPADCKRRPDQTLAWELQRVTGRLLKLLRRSNMMLMATKSASDEMKRAPPERFATTSRWHANAWPSCCASTNASERKDEHDRS